MKYLISIYVWLVGGLSYFLLFTFIIILSPFLTKEQLFKFQRFGGKVALFLIFFRFEINYEEDFDFSQNYIFMPNHVSMLDVLVLSANLPKYANAIEAQSHFKWPYYGWVIKILEQIPINRKSARESIKSFQIAKERIKKGRSIIVFPEGTRSKKAEMNSFKTLPFKFAHDAKTAIQPIGLIGMDKANAESFWVKPCKITINFGKPISAETVANTKPEELKQITREKIQELIK